MYVYIYIHVILYNIYISISYHIILVSCHITYIYIIILYIDHEHVCMYTLILASRRCRRWENTPWTSQHLRRSLSLSLVWMEVIGYVCMIWYDFIRLYCTSLYILYLYCRMTSTCSCFVWVWMFSIWFYWIIVHEYTCRWMRTDADAWDTHILCMLRK